MTKMRSQLIKRYSELIEIPTFMERYEYLKLNGSVAEDTFGSRRYLNQMLYTSSDWRNFRRDIIVRDMGCDLGIEEHEIRSELIIIHHMNPITIEDVINKSPIIFDPENVICTTDNTHKAIHYGESNLLIDTPITRTKNDTCPWRH